MPPEFDDEESQQKRWPDLEPTADPPAPVPEAPATSAGPLSDKTERLDDVIARLREHAAAAPAPVAPVPVAPVPVAPVASAPPSPPERRPEEAPPPVREEVAAPMARPAPAGRKVVVYGGSPPPPAPKPPRAVAPAALPVTRTAVPGAPVADAARRRMRAVGIGLVVAAIVVLFSLTLWILISLAR